MQLPRTSARSLAIWACNEALNRFIGEGLFGAALIDEVAVANRVEIVLRLGAAHIVEKLTVPIDT